MKCYKKYVLAYDFIVHNGKETTDEDYKSLYTEINTLSSLGIDYSKELESLIHLDEVYDKYIDLMLNEELVNKVAKALIKKGVLTHNNVGNCELTLMVWVNEVEDNNYLFDYDFKDYIWYELANKSYDLYLLDFEWKS